MAQVAQHTDAVHLRHNLVTKAAEPGVAALVTAGSSQVLSIVGDLHDPDTEFFKQRDISNLIFQGRGVLKAENDAGFPFGFCAPDVGRGAHRAIKSALSANQRFLCAILRIVSTNPSQIEHVQFAAVNPPRRMSANTARLHFGDDETV
jgi:hypothetical protein